MTEVNLGAADPLAECLAWLKADPAVTDAFTGGAAHISGLVEAPWPHVRLDVGPGGDLRDLRWDTETEVTVEITSDPEGRPGKAALRQLLIVALASLTRLPERDHSPGDAVVSRVRPSGVFAFTTLASGQIRWSAGVLVVIRPPTDSTP